MGCWHENFKAKRLNYNAPQSAVAALADIHPKTLSALENGRKKPSKELMKKLDVTIEQFNPKYKLYAIYDYVRVRFPTHDYQQVVTKVLQMQFKYFVDSSKGFYGYKQQFCFSDITIMISDDDDERGTLLELKGKGCRRMEYLLQAQNRSWNDFFCACFALDGKFKRLDIAINDTKGIIKIDELMKKAGTDECQTVFSKIQKISSAESLKNEMIDGKVGEGNTLYIGSLQSDIYFCIYEKDYEQYIKNGIPIEDADVKNRFEIRLKNDRAKAALIDLICNDDIEKTAYEIINRYVCFYEKSEDKDVKDWDIDYRWQWFIGKGREKLKLTMQPEPYDIEKTRRWVVNQVSPSISLLDKLDKHDGTHIVDNLKRVKLPDKQRKIFEQYTASVYDVIVADDYIADKGDIPLSAGKDVRKQCTELEKKLKDTMHELKEREKEIVMLRKRMNLDDYFV